MVRAIVTLKNGGSATLDLPDDAAPYRAAEAEGAFIRIRTKNGSALFAADAVESIIVNKDGAGGS